MSKNITDAFKFLIGTIGVLIIIYWGVVIFSSEPEQKKYEEKYEIEINDDLKIDSKIENDLKIDSKIENFDYSLINSVERKKPIAVVIDNFSGAHPLSGLENAAIIFEAPVEADITRLLAIFNQDYLPEKVGPVRSARSYFAEWAEEYNSIFVHAGGSSDFLEKAKQDYYQFYNLDEISYNGSYFWRDNKKDRPHNLYIGRNSILQIFTDKNLKNEIKPDFPFWLFDEEKIFSESPSGLIIKINYREPIMWQYDKEKGLYLRFQNGKAFFTEKGEQIGVKNLVVLKTEISVLDDIGHRFIKTQGEGTALIFQKGVLIQGVWKKTEKEQRTIFYFKNGEEIKFLPGSVWVEIVSENHEVIY